MEAARFRLVVQRHQQSTYRAAYRILADREEALDVAQDAFLALHRQGRAVAVERAGGWLYRVATNRALDRVRRRGRVRPLDVEPVAPPDDGPAEAAARAEEGVRALAELARLPERQRQVLAMRVLEASSFPAIADALGISEGAAKVHFRRGLQSLRRRLVRSPTRGDER